MIFGDAQTLRGQGARRVLAQVGWIIFTLQFASQLKLCGINNL